MLSCKNAAYTEYMNASRRQCKIAGELFLTIPGLLLIVLTIGELSGGMRIGLQHLVQLIPLVAVAVICWFYTRTGGILLTFFASFLAVFYIFSFKDFPFLAKLIITFILFGFPILAGILFLHAGEKEAVGDF
jgi:hypothetical protein